MEPSTLTLDDSALATFVRLGTHRQLRQPLSDRNVPVFRHCLHFGSPLEPAFFQHRDFAFFPFSPWPPALRARSAGKQISLRRQTAVCPFFQFYYLSFQNLVMSLWSIRLFWPSWTEFPSLVTDSFLLYQCFGSFAAPFHIWDQFSSQWAPKTPVLFEDHTE